MAVGAGAVGCRVCGVCLWVRACVRACGLGWGGEGVRVRVCGFKLGVPPRPPFLSAFDQSVCRLNQNVQ